MSDEVTYLTRYGMMADEAWRENRPKMYARLKKSGKLKKTLIRAQEGAKLEIAQMVTDGEFLPYAEEKVLPQWILLPDEEESPRLPSKRDPERFR